MLKAKCIECSGKKATFLFTGKTPKLNEYYHLEEQTGKSLELNGLFHAIIPEFYIWMFNNDQFIFDDGGITLDFRCGNWYQLKDILKQKYGEGTIYRYSNMNHQLKSSKDFFDIPEAVIEDFNNGNNERIKADLIGWGDYNEDQASKLVDIVLKLMNKLGVNTSKYNNIKAYLEKKEIERLNQQNKEYTDKIKSKFC